VGLQSIDQLSGGQKTRALLARLLLEQPDLLILDEPTNHLDVEAVEWLEGLLRTWDGALLIVSHDRYFLDNVVNRIWEMSAGRLRELQRQLQRLRAPAPGTLGAPRGEFNATKERFLGELDYIKRNIARDATKNQAVGRLRRLIRQVRVVEAGGLDLLLSKNWGEVMDEVDISEAKWGVADVEQAIKGLRSPLIRPPQLNLKLKTTLRSGNLVLRTTQCDRLPGKLLFRADPITLERGECAALIGPNGSGKTTFLRTVLGRSRRWTARFKFGASLKVGYFPRRTNGSTPTTPCSTSCSATSTCCSARRATTWRNISFRGEDVFKPVRLLSGGERGRLALAFLALQGANLLLLDEPSNHLDIPAQEVLQQVLEQFEGTILLVSHDRYLIDHLATQVWELREGTAGGLPRRLRGDDRRAHPRRRSRRSRSPRRSAPPCASDYAGSKQARADERKRAKAIADAESARPCAGGRTGAHRSRAGARLTAAEHRHDPATGPGARRRAGRAGRGDGGVGGVDGRIEPRFSVRTPRRTRRASRRRRR
jgi:ATP-binding cassette subfamily F protein 3